MTREELERKVSGGASTRQLAEQFGLCQSVIMYWMKKYGIKVSHPRRGGKISTNPSPKWKKCSLCSAVIHKGKRFCGPNCQHEMQYLIFVEYWKTSTHPPTVGNGMGISTYAKRFLRERCRNKCEQCGWGIANEHTGIVPLQVHHKNGDHGMARPQDLEMLCPNCHSLTGTFGGRNRGCGPQHRRNTYAPVANPRYRGKFKDAIAALSSNGQDKSLRNSRSPFESA